MAAQELVNGFKGGAIEELKRAEASAKVMKKDRGKQHDKLVSKNNKKVRIVQPWIVFFNVRVLPPPLSTPLCVYVV